MSAGIEFGNPTPSKNGIKRLHKFNYPKNEENGDDKGNINLFERAECIITVTGLKIYVRSVYDQYVIEEKNSVGKIIQISKFSQNIKALATFIANRMAIFDEFEFEIYLNGSTQQRYVCRHNQIGIQHNMMHFNMMVTYFENQFALFFNNISMMYFGSEVVENEVEVVDRNVKKRKETDK